MCVIDFQGLVLYFAVCLTLPIVATERQMLRGFKFSFSVIFVGGFDDSN